MTFGDIHLLLTHLTTLEVTSIAVGIFIAVVFAILIQGGKAKGTGENASGEVEERSIVNETIGWAKEGLLIQQVGNVLQRPHRKPRGRRLNKRWLMGLGLIGLIGVVLMAILGLVLFSEPVESLPFRKVVDITLPGGGSRFDYQSLDQRTGLLFIAHSGADMVTVFDTRSNRVVADIDDIPDVHGVLAIADLGRIYATASKEQQVYVIDEQTKSVIAKIPVGKSPDGMGYDPIDHELFVSNEDGHSDTVVNVRTEQVVTTVPLGGEAGNTQYDPVSGHIFIDVQTLNQLVAVNPKTNKIVARYPLPGCDHDHGLNIDAPQRLAFVACDGNAKLLMVDLRSMKVVTTKTVGNQPDVLALDNSWHFLYVSSESGIISVFDEHGRILRKVEEGYVAPAAHSIAVNQQTHYIYLPLQNIGGDPFLKVALLRSIRSSA
jgi:YVTN family beta-propeller protein